MKQFKRYLCIALAVIMMCLTGCGAELHVLTPEEETLIIHSAAYLIAKHNIQQKDGVNGMPLPENFEDTENSEENSQKPGGDEGSSTDKPEQSSNDASALAELIGQTGNLKITYEGSYVTANYKEGTAYIVEAEAGKTFYVMKFKMTNTTGADVVVDNALKSPIVKLVSEAVTVKSEVTFLSSDFSTYQGTIKAGQSAETILLFEVSEKVAEKITAPTLQITIGKTTKSIKL